MELRTYVAVFRKWWWLMVLAAIVAALASWLAVRGQPAIYQTSTTLLIGQSIDNPDPNYADFYTSERLAQTYSELVKREPILKNTARALGFEEQWARLRGQVGVNLVPGTQLMEIQVTDTDPQRAKVIADEVALQLIDMVQPEESAQREFIRSQAVTFPDKIEAAQEEIRQLEAELTGSFSARQIQDIQNQISSLQSQINTWQSTFAQYQLLLGENGANVLQVIEEAPVPTRPLGSSWMMQVLLAGAVGFGLAVGTAFLIEYLDDSLKTPEDVTRTTGLTTIGGISRISGNAPAEKLITIHHPKSPVSEAYRVMRTNLQFSSLDHPLRSMVVTSPNPMEGKSTTMANLGVVMAQSGKSVVLVDSDLRRPMLHRIFEVPNKSGLTSALLQEQPEPNGHLQDTGIENLRVLTSGPLPPNPSELLGSKRMQLLLEQLEREADIVILDTPPALPVTDAAVLSSQVDGVLVVTDAGKTRRGAARQAVDGLRKVGANLLGIALNRLSPRDSGAYYHYQYYYTSDGKGRRGRGGRWYQRIPLLGRLFTRT